MKLGIWIVVLLMMTSEEKIQSPNTSPKLPTAPQNTPTESPTGSIKLTEHLVPVLQNKKDTEIDLANLIERSAEKQNKKKDRILKLGAICNGMAKDMKD